MLRLTSERHFVIRTCGLYGVAGSAGKCGNFVETMLKKANEGASIRGVNDRALTATFAGDLAEAVCQLISTEAYGLYHVNAGGKCSRYQFAREIFELEKRKVDLMSRQLQRVLQPGAPPRILSPQQREAESFWARDADVGRRLEPLRRDTRKAVDTVAQ